MNFNDYFKELTVEERDLLCKWAGVSKSTIRNYYLHRDPTKRTSPKVETLIKIELASQQLGKPLKKWQLFGFFYDDPYDAIMTEYKDSKTQ